MSYTTNNFVLQLLRHSFGQGGAVALPNASESPHNETNTFPAGVGDVLLHLLDRYASWSQISEREIDWCFLVGGPGNGKSEALRTLAGVLKVDLPPRKKDAPAPRTVPQDWPLSTFSVVDGLEIVFINDASIPRENVSNDSPGSLYLDIKDGIERLSEGRTPTVVFGNINRGILVEEQAKLININESSQSMIISDVINWLVDPPTTEKSFVSLSGNVETILFVDPKKPYYGQFRIKLDGVALYNIVIHVVFLDTLSLFEPMPIQDHLSIGFASMPPYVAIYQPLGGFLEDGANRDKTIAGNQINLFVSPQKWDEKNCRNPDGTLCAAFNLCPFAQNVMWLRHNILRQRFLDTLRAAEISAARRFSYRDLLSYFSLAILGYPLDSWLTDGSHPCKWVESTIRELEQSNTSSSTVKLINQRIYNAIFPFTARTTNNWTRTRSSSNSTLHKAIIDSIMSESKILFNRPLLQSFIDIDPGTDVEPWVITGQGSNVRLEVLDAIDAIDVRSPSEQIDLWVGIADATCDIERRLDQALRDEIISELGRNSKDASFRVHILRKWRSLLLVRHVGLALGQFAFRGAIKAWMAEQVNALNEGDALDLGQGVRALILPSSKDDQYLLAPLRPRTYNLDKNLPANTLLASIPSKDLRVEILPQGDMLIAQVQLIRSRSSNPIEPIASLIIDLPIAREALLHLHEDSQSFTEIAPSAFARIERARASLVSRERMRNVSVYLTDTVGNLYRLAPHSGDKTMLRVIPVKRD